MNLINSSQDILFLVLAFCALWVTIALTWLLYYVINAVRQLHQAIRQVKSKIDAVDEVFSFIKDKVGSTTSYISMIVSGIAKVTELLGGREKPAKKSRR